MVNRMRIVTSRPSKAVGDPDHIKRPAPLFDLVDNETKRLILDMHKKGIGTRKICNALLDSGIESPPMRTPWSESSVNWIIKEMKKMEGNDEQT